VDVVPLLAVVRDVLGEPPFDRDPRAVFRNWAQDLPEPFQTLTS
jgi:hypothetical protein